MDYARGLIKKTVHAGSSVASGTVILADTMSRSKGRFTRQWHAPAGGVWGCMIHANTLLPQSRQFIPLATGLACCEAVREIGVEQATLRWVNDVLVDGRKLAGFLVESYTEPVHGEEFTLVGFGINVNNCSFPAELTPSSISLQQISVEKNLIFPNLLLCFYPGWPGILVCFIMKRQGSSGEKVFPVRGANIFCWKDGWPVLTRLVKKLCTALM